MAAALRSVHAFARRIAHMSRLRSLAFALAVASLASTPVAAQSPVRVHVVPTPTGFIDKAAKYRNDTHKELQDELKGKKKQLTLVDSPEAAQIVVELLSVEIVDGALHSTRAIFGGGVDTKPVKEFEAKAVLKVGDYTSDLVRRGPFTATVASRLAKDVGTWIKDNRAQLK